MYNALLSKVVAVIKQSTELDPKEEDRSEFFNAMFNPDAYLAYQEKKRKKEEFRNKLILGVTVTAVVGEAYHLAKRSGVVRKLFKR